MVTVDRVLIAEHRHKTNVGHPGRGGGGRGGEEGQAVLILMTNVPPTCGLFSKTMALITSGTPPTAWTTTHRDGPNHLGL